MRLDPGADPAPGLVEGAGGELVAAPVEVAQVVGQPHQEAESLDAEVGPGQGRLPPPVVGRLDERFQHVEGNALDTVAEQEALGPGKPVEGRNQPQDELVVTLDGGAGLAGAVGMSSRLLPLAGLGDLSLGGLRSIGLGGGQAFIPYSGCIRNAGRNPPVACSDQGALPPGPP